MIISNKTTVQMTAGLWLRNLRYAIWRGEIDFVAIPWPSPAGTSSVGGISTGTVAAAVINSVKADPRVESGVRQVRQQVEHDDGDHHDDHPRHQLREVAVAVGGEEVVAHPGIGEDPLRDDQPPEERTELDRRQRDDRQHRVAHGVLDEYAPLTDPLRPSGTEIVAVEGLEQRRPHVPGVDR